MSKIVINHQRTQYYARETIGQIIIDGKKFCYTLEDTVRPYGIKVYGETAIPSTPEGMEYNVGIIYSNSFKRDVLILYNQDDKVSIVLDGKSFKYIYAHGGNKHQDTLGCILVAFNRNDNQIYGTAEKALFNKIKGYIDQGHSVKWRIKNLNQAS